MRNTLFHRCRNHAGPEIHRFCASAMGLALSAMQTTASIPHLIVRSLLADPNFSEGDCVILDYTETGVTELVNEIPLILRTPTGITDTIGDEVKAALRGPKCAIAAIGLVDEASNGTVFLGQMETVSNLLRGIEKKAVVMVQSLKRSEKRFRLILYEFD